MIDVVDYAAGNAPSVIHALRHLGIPCRLASRPEQLASAERIVLPGVGAAAATMDSLRDIDVISALRDRVQVGGVPFLGICVGLQVLFDHSAEGDVDCLGWIAGNVERFSGAERVPQMGWNAVQPARIHPMWTGLPAVAHCYFVNSYYAIPTDPRDVIATTEYGVSFCAIAGRDNVVATQFHAEKSGPLGLRLLTNFASWDGTVC